MALKGSIWYIYSVLVLTCLSLSAEVVGQQESGHPLNILLISLPFPGHLNPVLAFADELVSRGHRVTVCTSVTTEYPGKYQKAAREHGVTFISFEDNDIELMVNTSHDETTFLNLHKAMVAYYNHLSIFSLHLFEAVEPSLENRTFDIAISSEFLLSVLACISSRWKLPVVMLGGTLQFLPHVEPPWPWPDLMFPSSSDNMTFLQRLLYTLSMPMKSFGFKYTLKSHVAALQAYCPGLTLTLATLGPGVYYPYIVKTVIGFEFARTLMPLVEYVGPVLSQHPAPLSEDTALKKWLDNQPDKSVVYVSMGSKFELSKEHGIALLEGVMKTNLSLLWSLKKLRQGILEDLDYDSKRVFVSDWTPQFSVLGSSTIHSAVLHGGFGGLTEALWHGVPVVGFPQTVEQEASVSRLYHNGLGLRLDVESFTASNIAECISDLNKGNYRHKLKRLRKMFELAGGSKRAADLVELYADVGYSHLIPAYARYDWNWIQYYNADVWLVMVSVVMLCGLLLTKFLKCVIYWCCTKKTKMD